MEDQVIRCEWAGNITEQNRGWGSDGDCGELAGRAPSLSKGIIIPLYSSYWVPSTILKALHASPHFHCTPAL